MTTEEYRKKYCDKCYWKITKCDIELVGINGCCNNEAYLTGIYPDRNPMENK